MCYVCKTVAQPMISAKYQLYKTQYPLEMIKYSQKFITKIIFLQILPICLWFDYYRFSSPPHQVCEIKTIKSKILLLSCVRNKKYKDKVKASLTFSNFCHTGLKLKINASSPTKFNPFCFTYLDFPFLPGQTLDQL